MKDLGEGTALHMGGGSLDWEKMFNTGRVCQLNCVMLPCLELLGDNPERLFLGKLRQGSIPCLSYVPLVA